jgi:nucleoside-diphosphate-sugar epimerase
VARGDTAWPNIHVDDLGEAYTLALERAPASTAFNLAGGEATPRSVAAAIGRLIGWPERTRAVPSGCAADVLPYVDGLGGMVRVNARRAHTVLGWHPHGPALVDDIVFGSYRALIGRHERSGVADRRAGSDTARPRPPEGRPGSTLPAERANLAARPDGRGGWPVG